MCVDYDDDYLVDKAKRWQGCCWRGQAYATLRRRGAGGGGKEGLAELAGGWGPAETSANTAETSANTRLGSGAGHGRRVMGERPRVATIGKALIFN